MSPHIRRFAFTVAGEFTPALSVPARWTRSPRSRPNARAAAGSPAGPAAPRARPWLRLRSAEGRATSRWVARSCAQRRHGAHAHRRRPVSREQACQRSHSRMDQAHTHQRRGGGQLLHDAGRQWPRAEDRGPQCGDRAGHPDQQQQSQADWKQGDFASAALPTRRHRCLAPNCRQRQRRQ